MFSSVIKKKEEKDLSGEGTKKLMIRYIYCYINANIFKTCAIK